MTSRGATCDSKQKRIVLAITLILFVGTNRTAAEGYKIDPYVPQQTSFLCEFMRKSKAFMRRSKVRSSKQCIRELLRTRHYNRDWNGEYQTREKLKKTKPIPSRLRDDRSPTSFSFSQRYGTFTSPFAARFGT